MPRAYSFPINITTGLPTPAQIDVFELLVANGKPLEIVAFELGQTSEVGDAQEEILVLVLKRVTGSATSGSGGGTSTGQPMHPNDIAVGATLATGNTTKLTGGISTELARFAWQVRVPLLYQPVEDERFLINANTRAVLELVTTPADAITAAVGRLVVRELV